MRIRSPEWFWRCSRLLQLNGFCRTARMVKFVNFVLHRALLPAEAIVGEDITLEHYGLGVVIHPAVEIGSGCRIYHHVTIAAEVPIDSTRRVVIGDRVTIGVNAVILARPYQGLTIGDDAIIGAGAIVTTDVPARAIMVGVPARVARFRRDDELPNAVGKG